MRETQRTVYVSYPRNFRIDYYQDSSVHWHGRGKVVHLPSGLVEEFDIAWNDQTGIARAKERIQERLVHCRVTKS